MSTTTSPFSRRRKAVSPARIRWNSIRSLQRQGGPTGGTEVGARFDGQEGVCGALCHAQRGSQAAAWCSRRCTGCSVSAKPLH